MHLISASEKQKDVVLCEFPASQSYIERKKSTFICLSVRVVVRRQFMEQFFPCTQWVRESNSCLHAWRPVPLSGEPSRRLSQDFLNCEMGTPPVSQLCQLCQCPSEFLVWFREYVPQLATPHAFLPRPGLPGGPLKRWDNCAAVRGPASRC